MGDKAISLGLAVLLVCTSVMAGTGTVLAKQDNPSVPAGAPQPNWNVSDGPPGSVGGPGSDSSEGTAVVVKGNPSVSAADATPAVEEGKGPVAEWWIPTKPYDLWKKDKLEAQLKRLQEFKTKLTAEKSDDSRIALIDDQIREIKKVLARTF